MGIIGLPSPAPEWPTAAPAAVGLSADIGERLEEMVARGDFAGLHGLLLVRRGALALDRYFGGEDEIWGKPRGVVAHSADALHDMRSVTKSIVSLLYGIALAEGLVPGVAAPVIDCFPHLGDLATPAKRRITIGHALSMRLGLAWNEDLAYSDPDNGEHQMEQATDRYRNILERSLAHPPGRVFTYCGGATALLGKIIANGAGQRLEAFARQRLFEPLGIAHLEWINGSDGEAAASSGLRLRPRDLARVGQMVLNHGTWRGRQIVPRNWLTNAFKPRVHAGQGLRYGYQWWIGRLARSGKPWIGAFGNGGQRLIVIPSLSLLVVIIAGNYGRADQWKMPLRLMNTLVMPGVR
jgi:CubicO group peptidase (beta-lactamase class C family)